MKYLTAFLLIALTLTGCKPPPTGPLVVRDISLERVGIMLSAAMRMRGIVMGNSEYRYTIDYSVPGRGAPWFSGINIISDGDEGHTELKVSAETVKDIVERILVKEGYEPWNVVLSSDDKRTKLIVTFTAVNKEAEN